ncbi:MAG: hypothetical protein R3C59_15685 [Planctomycetaceae bacterium]
MNNDQQILTDDSLWHAFRYVAAELSDAEAESFEQQLLNDAELCEAVIEVTRLTSAVASGSSLLPVKPVTLVASTPPVALPSANGSPSRVGRTVAVVAALCCCVIFVTRTSSVSNPEPSDVIAVDGHSFDSDAELLVSVWAAGELHEDDMETDGTDLLNHDLDVPEWLLTALSPPTAGETPNQSLGESKEDGDWY